MTERIKRTERRNAFHCRLPKAEMLLYWLIWLPCVVIPYWYTFKISKKYLSVMYQEYFSKGWSILNCLKDISDNEWSFWRQHFVFYLIISSANSLIILLSSKFPDITRKTLLVVTSLLLLQLALGCKGVTHLLIRSIVYFSAVRTIKSSVLVWAWILSMTYFLNYEPWQSLQISWISKDEEVRFLVVACEMMCNLRMLSFGLEYCWFHKTSKQSPRGSSTKQALKSTSRVSSMDSPLIARDWRETSKEEVPENSLTLACHYGFLDFIAYVFYIPLFFNGPLLTFNQFRISMPKSDTFSEKATEDSTVTATFSTWSIFSDISKCLIYFFLIEILFHYIYSTSLSRHDFILSTLGCWETVGIIWTQLQFFYLKYVIFYGTAGIFVRFDGMEPPGYPKCISSLFTFVEMWRYFDKGLYYFLKRYIYFPTGGSRHGLFWQMFGTLCSFGFVGFWHGGNRLFFTWALTNCTGICAEAIATKLRSTGVLLSVRDRMSQCVYRRICAIGGVFCVIPLILSNMVFLTGVEATVIYIQRLFVSGWSVCPVVLFLVMYCTVQCIIEVNLPSKE